MGLINLSNQMATVEEIDDKNVAGEEDKDEEMPDLENQDGPKLNRGEKKCRKALMKLGMKQFPGITRVTLRKRDGYIFVINEPEVLRAADGGNSFVCFGEIKIDDPNQRLQQAEAKRFAEAQAEQAKNLGGDKAASKEEPKTKAVDEAPADEEGVTTDHINMVMEHTGCTRNEAIGALKESNNDMINAVMKLTK